MIERHDHDGIAVISLAHGGVNALDADLCIALIDTFGELGADDSRAVVLTGAGTAFSAGLDLTPIIAGDTAYIRRLLPVLDAAFEAVFTIAKPVVAAINGHAIAGGCVLACACDHRVMAAGTATIGVPELVVGVPFPTAALEITRHAVGSQHLRTLTTSGRLLDPDAALAIGLVDEVVDAERLVERASAVATGLSGGLIPAATFAIHKRQLISATIERIIANRPHDMGRVTEAWSRPETHRWIADYLERLRQRRR